jgi:hypothetical protein
MLLSRRGFRGVIRAGALPRRQESRQRFLGGNFVFSSFRGLLAVFRGLLFVLPGEASMRALIVLSGVLLLAASSSAQQAGATRDIAAEVLAFERTMEAAVVRGDVAFLDKVCAKDFTFTHGDGWTTGGEPLRVENREQWLASVGKAPYLFRDLGSVKVELHGDVAITYGMYRARNKNASPDRTFTVWFERVYAYRNGNWQYLSHRTVHGPTYGS